MLAVEHASSFDYPSQIVAQQEHTSRFSGLVQKAEVFLGAVWWEAEDSINNYEGGRASLYHPWFVDGLSNEAPTDTPKTWGSFAQSPS